MPQLDVSAWKDFPATVHRLFGESNGPFAELVLIEDVESVLRVGDAAAWKAGAPVGHCLENRSDLMAVVLVVGARAPRDVVQYPDYRAALHRDVQGRRCTAQDGSPLPEGPVKKIR